MSSSKIVQIDLFKIYKDNIIDSLRKVSLEKSCEIVKKDNNLIINVPSDQNKDVVNKIFDLLISFCHSKSFNKIFPVKINDNQIMISLSSFVAFEINDREVRREIESHQLSGRLATAYRVKTGILEYNPRNNSVLFKNSVDAMAFKLDGLR